MKKVWQPSTLQPLETHRQVIPFWKPPISHWSQVFMEIAGLLWLKTFTKNGQFIRDIGKITRFLQSTVFDRFEYMDIHFFWMCQIYFVCYKVPTDNFQFADFCQVTSLISSTSKWIQIPTFTINSKMWSQVNLAMESAHCKSGETFFFF